MTFFGYVVDVLLSDIPIPVWDESVCAKIDYSGPGGHDVERCNVTLGANICKYSKTSDTFIRT